MCTASTGPAGSAQKTSLASKLGGELSRTDVSKGVGPSRAMIRIPSSTGSFFGNPVQRHGFIAHGVMQRPPSGDFPSAWQVPAVAVEHFAGQVGLLQSAPNQPSARFESCSIAKG